MKVTLDNTTYIQFIIMNKHCTINSEQNRMIKMKWKEVEFINLQFCPYKANVIVYLSRISNVFQRKTN